MENNRLVLTENAIKRHSKRLQKLLNDLGHEYSLTQSQQEFAKILGLNSWHELRQILSNELSPVFIPSSNLDENIKDEIDNLLWERGNEVYMAFEFMLEKQNADVMVFRSNDKIFVEFGGYRNIVGNKKITRKQIQIFIEEIVTKEQYKQFEENGDIGIKFEYKGIKFDVYIVKIIVNGEQKIEILIDKPIVNIPKIVDLLPEKVIINLFKNNGLTIITGSTRNGKTTLLKSIFHGCKERFKGINSAYYDSYNDCPINTKSMIKLVEQMRCVEHLERAIEDVKTTTLPLYISMHKPTISSCIMRLANTFSHEIRREKIQEIISNTNLIIGSEIVPTINGGRTALYTHLILTDRIKKEILKMFEFFNYDDVKLNTHLYNFVAENGKEKFEAAKEAYDNKIISENVFSKFEKLKRLK